jgi:hypothetical protein
MSRIVVTAPDGSKTVITRTSGCGGCFWFALAVFVVFYPAAAFPLWGAILAYIAEATVLGVWLHQQWGKRHPAA